MATKISAMTAITSGNLTDAVQMEMVDATGATTKGIVSQLRTQLLSAGVITAAMLGSAIVTSANIAAGAGITYSQLTLTGGIVNADIASGAAITDSKLATISTATKVANSATTATNANTGSAIVARDANGDFSARIITAVNQVSFGSGGGSYANSLAIRSDGNALIFHGGTSGYMWNNSTNASTGMALSDTNNLTIGVAGGTSHTIFTGSGYGAANSSVQFNGLTSGAGAGVGTLTNAPASTNPTFWMPINIAGTVKYAPLW